MGMTWPLFHNVGEVGVLNHFVNKMGRGMHCWSAISLRTLGGQLSGPAALFGFRLLNSVNIISHVIGTSFRVGTSTLY